MTDFQRPESPSSKLRSASAFFFLVIGVVFSFSLLLLWLMVQLPFPVHVVTVLMLLVLSCIQDFLVQAVTVDVIVVYLKYFRSVIFWDLSIFLSFFF